MTAPITVAMYRCGSCGSTHDSIGNAEQCCVCKCGRPIDREGRRFSNFGRSECARCRVKSALRLARENVRRYERELGEAQKRVDDLSASLAAMGKEEKREEEKRADKGGAS